ncbi:MAG TPA: ferrous iron transport protein B, partial [Candidatus Omnitrophica bacterium]|nr:ferrous iron transport protein B [Candidatus Omnitrophota bacterium]
MKRIKIALAGNPNSGKTTVFNSLTGSRQHVGNWPGVTVERKEGKFSYDGFEINVVDLPGTYSLTAYSLDERIARDFLTKETPDVVVAVIDASNLERNLYLVAQLLELRVNVVLDLNMMDLVEAKGTSIDTEKLSLVLGIPVVKTVANKGEGIEDLKKRLLLYRRGKRPGPFRVDYDHDIEAEIENLSDILKDKGLPKEYPLRWLIVKLLEGDAEILERIKKLPEGSEIEEAVLKTTASLEKLLGYDLETAMVERRYGFLEGLVKECCEKRLGIEERLEISNRIDSVVTNKFLGIPLFLALMWLTFQLVFTFGAPLAELIDSFFGWSGEAAVSGLTALNAPEWLSSLVSDGIIGGVGSVLVFLPNILLLFLVIAILEASGYMARAAFVMDRF